MTEEVDIASIPCCPENFEPLFKLGLCFEAKKQIEESIKCYQKCIRINDGDRRLWQCLGQAYFVRGSYVNANKCFIRSIQLRVNHGGDGKMAEENYYEEIRIGEIKTLLNDHEEGSTIYKEVIKQSPDNILAFLGLARVKLIMACDLFDKSDKSEALITCDEVFSLTSKVISLQPKLIQPLNIIVNCCLSIYSHLNQDEEVTLSGKKYTRLGVLNISKNHTMKALSLKELPYLWYHLFIIYSLLFSETSDEIDLKKSILCLEKCKQMKN